MESKIEEQKKTKKSNIPKILEEWYITQQNYNFDLYSAINHIKSPMLANYLIDSSQIMILFPQYDGILALSDSMLKVLAAACKTMNIEDIRIGDQLLYFLKFYKLYGSIFGQVENSRQLIVKLAEQQHDKMKQIEENLRTKYIEKYPHRGNITILDCLQQPQFRIFRYQLFLARIIKSLPPDHSDLSAIKKVNQSLLEINSANNNLREKLVGQKKKAKIDRLFGKTIDISSEYKSQMSAETLNFPARLYIFSNLIIVSIADTSIGGLTEQKRYTNLYLSEHSFVCNKKEQKYYKNALTICGKNECLHFFLNDAGSRYQIYSKVSQVISDLKHKTMLKRIQQPLDSNNFKLSFAIDSQTKNTTPFTSQLQIQVIAVDMRPLATLTNDTIYLTKFSLPLYLEDYLAVYKPQNIDKWIKQDFKLLQENTISQYIEVHLSQLVSLLDYLKQNYPEIQFPDIDPLTKQINAFTESKKNTKVYELRTILIEQFFNYLFRHPIMCQNPTQLLKKFKINQFLWNYITNKNQIINQKPKDKNYIYAFDYQHCSTCKSIASFSINYLQKIFGNQLEQKQKQSLCINFYNLLRISLLKIPKIQFQTLKLMLIYQNYQQGRIDYFILPRRLINKKYQELTVYLLSYRQQLKIITDYTTRIGELMVDICRSLEVDHLYDHRLVLTYDGYTRILDQDQLVFDILSKYELEVAQFENEEISSRNTFSQQSVNREQSFFDIIKKAIPFCSKPIAKITLRKVIYLPLQLDTPLPGKLSRSQIIVEELFTRLIYSQISLELQKWGQLAAIAYILYFLNKQKNASAQQTMSYIADLILPPSKKDIARNKIFSNAALIKIDEYRKKSKQELTLESAAKLHQECFELAFGSIKYYTYFVPATAKLVPTSLIHDSLGPISGDCFLGVNYKQIIVLREKTSQAASVRLSLEDVEIIHTTYSLFIRYSYQISELESVQKKGEYSHLQLRFDNKMLFHFYQLFYIYKSLRQNFLNDKNI